MTLKDDLIAKIDEYAASQWDDIPNGYVVPTPQSLTFGNTGIRIDATVLYADINGSTDMVDALRDTLAAEYYKAYLHCAAKIIKNTGGDITAYDGDRVMAIYVGNEQCKNAVDSALQLNWALKFLINPIFARVYGKYHRPISHTIGIDCGKLLAAKTGVRVESDLVWVGPAANYASKLNSFKGLDPLYQIRITEFVMTKNSISALTRALDGKSIWDGPYNDLSKRGKHYRTDCHMAFD